MLRSRLKKLPGKVHVTILVGLVLCALTIVNVSSSLVKTKPAPVYPRQTAGAATSKEGTTTEVIYRGSPQPDVYVYTHPTAGYSLQVPPNWLLGFTGTPYNPHLATVLHSPDFLKEPVEGTESIIRSGSEIFIYVEPPRAKAPTMQAEYDFIASLGETNLGSLTNIVVDGTPGLNYYRVPGGDILPFQTAIVYKDNRMYRFLYRTALQNPSDPLPSFVRDQAIYEQILATFTLPAQPPSSKYQNL